MSGARKPKMAPSGVTNCLEMSQQEEIQPDRDCYGENAGMEVGDEGSRFAMLASFVSQPTDKALCAKVGDGMRR